MLGKFLILAVLASAQGMPFQPTDIHVWSDDCIPDEHHLLAHEYDCTKFYYCEYGWRHINPTSCAPGTEFSYRLQTCVHPIFAQCDLPGVPPTTPAADCTTTESTTTTAPTTTTTTTAPTTTTTTTAPTTTTTTTAPTTTTTTSAPTTTTTTTAPTTTTTTTAPTTTTTTTAPTTTTTTASTTTAAPCDTQSPILENGCPSDFHVHKLLPHETNCSRFYYCNFGQKVERECAPGTYFNYEIQVCDWPHNVNCSNSGDGSITTAAPGGGSSSGTTATPGGGGSCGDNDSGVTTCPPVDGGSTSTTPLPGGGGGATLPNGCPADFHVHQLLPHETNCSKFYYCNFGNKVERDCAPCTHFNPEIQVCDWPWKAKCTLEHNGVYGPCDENGFATTPSDGGCSGGPTCPPGSSTTETPGGSSSSGTTATPGGSSSSGTTATPGGGGSCGDNDSGVTTCPPVDGGSTSTTPLPGGGGGATLPNGCPADFHVHQLLPHETNCSKFYYCNFGNKVERDCAPCTHFNPEIQVCDWPWKAKCTLEHNGVYGPCDENGFATTPSDGGCSGGPTCPPGSSTTETPGGSSSSGTTATPGGSSSSGTTATPGGGGSCGDNDSGVTTCPPVDGGSTSTTPLPGGGGGATLPNGCPADFHVHQLLPHETNCSKFYYCNFGNKVERDCAPCTHFNPEIQVCDWPWKAKCTLEHNGVYGPCDENGFATTPSDGGCSGGPTCPPGSSTTETPGGSSSSGTTATPGGSSSSGTTATPGGGGSCGDNDSGVTTCPPVDGGSASTTPLPGGGGGATLPNGCPADFHVHQLLPHETNCSKFYYCNFGNKVERDCAPCTHFNPEIQVCDWPWNAKCTLEHNGVYGPCDENGFATTPSDGGCSGGPTCPPVDGGSASTTPLPGGGGGATLPNGCPADFHVHQLLPHETNCSKFYYCNFGNKVERDCAPCTHFNPEIQVCDWPWNAKCTLEHNGVYGPCDENGFATTPSDGGCSGGPTCPPVDGGSASTTPLPGGGGGATLPNGCPADFHVHQLLPHETNCSKFYYCNFGNKVERDCAPCTHFNPEIQVCDWPWNAKCTLEHNGVYGPCDENGFATTPSDGGCSGGPTCPPGSSTTETPGASSSSGTTTTPGGSSSSGTTATPGGSSSSGTTPSPGGSSTTTASPSISSTPSTNPCAIECNILPWAHETDCDKFWRCEGSVAVVVTCAEGLHFNPVTATCDFACNANCVRDDIQATAGSDGLKLFVPWDQIDDDMQQLIDKATHH